MTSPAPESCNPTTEDHPKVPAARSPTLRGHRPAKILSQPKHTTGGINFILAVEEPFFVVQVVDRQAVGRGVTGWCRAAQETSCHPIQQVVFIFINKVMKIILVIFDYSQIFPSRPLLSIS